MFTCWFPVSTGKTLFSSRSREVLSVSYKLYLSHSPCSSSLSVDREALEWEESSEDSEQSSVRFCADEVGLSPFRVGQPIGSWESRADNGPRKR